MKRRFSAYTFALLALGLTALAPTPSAAAEFELEAHGAGQHAYDASFDPLGSGETPNVFTAGTLGVGYGLEEHLGIDGLFGYAAIGRAGSRQTQFDGDFSFDWNRGLYLAGVEYGYEFGAIRPFVRVTAGLARQRLRFSSTAGDTTTFSEVAVDFATRNSVGVALHTPYAASDPEASDPALALSEHFNIGLTLESGYLWQTPARFDGLTGPDRDEDPWQRTGVDLGELDASGWFWAIGAVVRMRL